MSKNHSIQELWDCGYEIENNTVGVTMIVVVTLLLVHSTWIKDSVAHTLVGLLRRVQNCRET